MDRVLYKTSRAPGVAQILLKGLLCTDKPVCLSCLKNSSEVVCNVLLFVLFPSVTSNLVSRGWIEQCSPASPHVCILVMIVRVQSLISLYLGHS